MIRGLLSPPSKERRLRRPSGDEIELKRRKAAYQQSEIFWTWGTFRAPFPVMSTHFANIGTLKPCMLFDIRQSAAFALFHFATEANPICQCGQNLLLDNSEIRVLATLVGCLFMHIRSPDHNEESAEPDSDVVKTGVMQRNSGHRIHSHNLVVSYCYLILFP